MFSKLPNHKEQEERLFGSKIPSNCEARSDRFLLEALRCGQIAYTKAQAIARVKEASERQCLLSEAIAENLSLNQIRERIGALPPKSEPDAKSASVQAKASIQAATRRLTSSKVWEDQKKWKQVQSLLQKLEALIEAE